MSYLNYAAFDAAALARDPFPHLLVTNFIAKDDISRIAADFPALPGPGAFPPGTFALKGYFAGLMDELTRPSFRAAVERKLKMDLAPFPLVYTVRGEVRAQDGGVHTDSTSKLVTVLLYLNEDWTAQGGRLRLLRSSASLADPAVEIAPIGGTLLIFRRSDNSWHGHLPYVGTRRAVQLNWMRDARIAAREQRRHLWSARLKTLVHAMSGRSEGS